MLNKKLLIIGDSNCLPRYSGLQKDIIRVEDTYVYQLQKKLENFDIQTMIIGGITTPELINFAIPYFNAWKPNFIIVHSGINDIKSQFIKNSKANLVYRILSKFNINKKKIKEKFIYNKNLIRFKSTPKVSIEDLRQQVIKFKNLFNNSKILWLEIYSDEKIDQDRPNTSQRINDYNNMLREVLKNSFIELQEIKNISNFTSDGFHLNKSGQFLLFEKLIKIILNDD